MPSQPERILVVGPAWIGDMVMAQSLFMALRARLPAATIDVLAPAATARLVARMPEVDDAVIMNVTHGKFAWSRRRTAARELRERGYDQAIVPQRSAKAALVPWLAGIARRTGYRGELRPGLINDLRTLDKTRYPLKAQHYALLGTAAEGDALGPMHWPRLSVDAARQNALIAALGLDLDRPVVGFAPGAAYGGAKAWPTRHYAALAARLDAAGQSCWIFGSAADREVAAAIAAAAPKHGVNLAERTTLVDIVDLAARTTQFVGNDTGVMHLASAAAPRVIGLYGSTDPDYAPPLAPTSQRLWRGMDCSPCRRRQCPLGHHACMEDLPVRDVFTACTDPGTATIASLHAIAHYHPTIQSLSE
ncbi:lipopolysaccharide heptosyltransferase II [Salinisphaera sp. LB1]|uniref:lipopolysaccharide heptosyltransferase II n=1 Tax=Salinisphaera sp. LB1 TaxID=2183911 RepID=UPI000D7057D0|nr:lipopolysaccharide heptosyltransferase II [Salinisphaera sp. LB1]AWN14698.1 ADP-heptose--lipooligosaccharide heptosyltransferase II [Salinisphaera sp. LB1]